MTNTVSLVRVNYFYSQLGLSLPSTPLVLLPDMSKQVVKIKDEDELFPIASHPLPPPLPTTKKKFVTHLVKWIGEPHKSQVDFPKSVERSTEQK